MDNSRGRPVSPGSNGSPTAIVALAGSLIGERASFCPCYPNVMSFAPPRRLLAIALLLILPGLFWGLPSAVTAQVDAPVPLGPLLFFAEYGSPQLDTIYPAFHQLLLLPLYGAAMAGYWLMGGISHLTSAWPYGMRDVRRSSPH